MKQISFLIWIFWCCPCYSVGQNLQSVSAFGGSGNEWAVSVTLDSADNTYVVGYFDGQTPADFDPGPGIFSMTSIGTDAFISKIDKNGNLVWAKQIGGAGSQVIRCIKYDGGSGLYLAGMYDGLVDFDPGLGIYNLSTTGSANFLMKLDTAGNFIWASNAAAPIVSIDMDSSKNIYIAGVFTMLTDFGSGVSGFEFTPLGQSDLYVEKMDSSGGFIWALQIGSISGEGVSSDKSLKSDKQGNVYLTGGFLGTLDLDPGSGTYMVTADQSVDDYEDAFILKLNSAGNFEWGHSMGSWYIDGGTAITLDHSGNVYTAGIFVSTVDFDPGAGVANLTSDSFDYESFDTYILKLNNSGDFLWVKRFGGVYDDFIRDINIDFNNSIYLLGDYEGLVDADSDTGTYLLNNDGTAYSLKLDSNGLFSWANNMGGFKNVSSFSISNSGEVYSIGEFACYGNVLNNFDPQGTNYTLSIPASNAYDVFLAKYSSQPSTLPIVLTYFSATAKNEDVLLEWQTASEASTDYFIVERSIDARQWSELTQIKAEGISGGGKKYTTTDNERYSGTTYYRLRQVDRDGSMQYSPVRSVTFGQPKRNMTVYPNPNAGITTLSGIQNDIEIDGLKVLNSIGQDITTQTIISKMGNNAFTIDLSRLPSGVYILHSSAGDNTLITKL